MSARFPVQPGETVTAFALGPLTARPFAGTPAPLEDRVDYRFVNGFVDVGDLPCRTATWDEVATRQMPPMPEVPDTDISLPGFNRRLDFSGFWHLPHRLARGARTRLIPSGDGAAPFRLATCGGVHVWVDGAHVAAFEPYRRNEVQETALTLPLRPEGSEVVLLIEEMAERDTSYFVELTWVGEGTLTSEVPSQADPETLDLLMALARDIRPDAVVFSGDAPVTLRIDAPAPRDVAVRASVPPSVHLTHQPPLFKTDLVLARGADTLSFDTTGLGDGYHPLDLTFSIGQTRLHRRIAFARMADLAKAHLPGTLAARKRAALAHAADHGEPRIGRLLAACALGRDWDTTAESIIADTLDGITTRRDCSDFVMVPLLWLLHDHASALPETVADAARKAVLGYRYWMDEPGNDTMWFWSENHVLCFHVSEYLAGRLCPEAVFPNSGMTGAQHAVLAARRLGRWLTSVEEHGLAEWNSAAYYPIDFIGLLALAHLAEGDIRSRARAILDRLFTMIALHTSGGVAAGSMGRAYDKELRAGPLTELAPFAAVAFGQGWLGKGVAALPMFCLSDYAPPEDLAALAAPAPRTAIETRYIQGFGDQGRLATFKTADMQLSAAIDAMPGASGHQQHLIDLQAAHHPFARIWINHPGDDDPWGAERPSYWAGSGIMPRLGMAGETALLFSDLGADPRLAFTHAYAPLAAFDAHVAGPDYLVLASGRGAAVLKATGPIEPVSTGPGAGLEWRCAGRRTGWALWIAAHDGDSLDSLAACAADCRLSFVEGTAALRLTRAGRPDLTLDYATGLTCGDTPCPFPTHARAPKISTRRFPEA
ncbi:hypothetical protein [Roseibium sp. Sym1]|uniref:hypothetical protein n=1 Tax=Roseibium sp. Sym1 TaxID=3016006 RepID=UPI0022B4045E|nr:hypothetical protein [Roseibium sp. Sym1]